MQAACGIVHRARLVHRISPGSDFSLRGLLLFEWWTIQSNSRRADVYGLSFMPPWTSVVALSTRRSSSIFTSVLFLQINTWSHLQGRLEVGRDGLFSARLSTGSQPLNGTKRRGPNSDDAVYGTAYRDTFLEMHNSNPPRKISLCS
jgi:hypothetical protein